MKWILAVIATEGITEILLHSNLLEKIRTRLSKFWLFSEILSCGWCLSLWISIFVCSLIFLHLEIILVPIVIHRLSNYWHFGYGILKKIRWRE